MSASVTIGGGAQESRLICTGGFYQKLECKRVLGLLAQPVGITSLC